MHRHAHRSSTTFSPPNFSRHAWRCAKYPLARGLAAWEAVLGPGDAVAFPPRWAHYTESRSLSASLTWRFRAGAEADTEHGREV